MSQKTVISVGSSGAPALSDSDEDLDLTDTKLLSSDDEELKKYIDIPITKESVTSPDGDYIESFRFIPLTSASLVTEEKIVVTTKDAPIVLLSDTDDDLTEIELKSKSLHSDLPDYESPVEDETEDVKPALFDRPDKADSDDLAYDELLEMCGQDVGDTDDRMDADNIVHDDDDDDDDDFQHSATTKVKSKIRQKRISPYNVKDRNIPIKGKGKQPVSGVYRFKSTQKKPASPVADDADQDLVYRDSARPICYGDGPIDLNVQVKEEEKPVVPPPPMMCESCDKSEGHNSMVQCCDGHIVCMRCVEASTKKILVGEKKGSVECPQSDCTSSVPMSELRKALPAIVLDLLEDKWNKETLEALENMKDAVKCPGCSYSAVLDMSLKRFQCVQCKEAYCRYCDKKWAERKTHDLCIRTKQWTSTVTGNVVNIPAQWSDADTDSTNGVSENHTLVELDSSSAEFYDVVHFMNKHMNSTVKKIFRIQNERLWEKYSLTRSHMVADLGELNINEKRLFHGTHGDVIEAICKEGFDWRLCGKHGTVYGQGTYFAKSPVISHRYSSGNLSRRGRNINSGGSGLFAMFFGNPGRHPSQYKPPLRFGAPITTTQSSGFTFGATTTQSSGFTFGASRSSQPTSSTFAFGSPAAAYHQGFNLGAAPTTTTSGFTFGSVPSHSTGIALPAYISKCSKYPITKCVKFNGSSAHFDPGSNSNVGAFGVAPPVKKYKILPLSRPGGNDNSINLPDPACLHSKQKQSTVSSTTGGNSSSSSKGSCSNCIFCSPKRKANDSSSSTTAGVTGGTAVPAGSGTGSTSSGNGTSGSLNDFRTAQENWMKLKQKKRAALLKSIPKSNTGAHLFARPSTSAPGFSFGGSSCGVGSGFTFGTGGGNSNTGGNGSGGSSGSGFTFGTAGGNSNTGGNGSGGGSGSGFTFGTSGGNSNTGGNGSAGNSAGNFGGFRFGVDTDQSGDNDHFMFLARVLVGRPCVGTHEMRRPAKDREGHDTHSAVEKEHKPSIFVIFDNNQCYPEYIIQYSTSCIV